MIPFVKWMLVLVTAAICCGCDGDKCGDPPVMGPDSTSIDLPGCSKGAMLTTTGGCTATCKAGQAGCDHDADPYGLCPPDWGYDEAYVVAVSEGLCSIHAKMADGRAYEAQVRVSRYVDTGENDPDCPHGHTPYYISLGYPAPTFLPVDSGTPASQITDAAADLR